MIARGGREWVAGRLVRRGRPGICVHNVGTTPGMWCSACGEGPREARVVCTGGVLTRSLQTEVSIWYVKDSEELEPGVYAGTVVDAFVPVPQHTFPEVRRAALVMAFEALADDVDSPDRDRFMNRRINRLMRRDDGPAL